VDTTANTVTVAVVKTKGEPAVEKVFALEKHVRVFVDTGKLKDKSRPYGLGDLTAGSNVTLLLSVDQKSVIAIRAEGQTIHGGSVKSVDLKEFTITLHHKAEGEKTYTVSKDVVISLDGKSEAKKLADVPIEADVTLKLLPDQKTVAAISARGRTHHGIVRGNAGNDSITIGGKEGDKTFTVAKDAQILVEKNRPVKLEELIDGTLVQLQLSVDKSAALEIHAEGPSFKGKLKAVDTDKNIITLTIIVKKGTDGEDMEFKITKDTLVATEINGVALRLKDLGTDKNVVVRLTLDQKAVARITVLGE